MLIMKFSFTSSIIGFGSKCVVPSMKNEPHFILNDPEVLRLNENSGKVSWQA
jgi:hypothetical protein